MILRRCISKIISLVEKILVEIRKRRKNMSDTKIVAPKYELLAKFETFFQEDPDVQVKLDGDEISLYVQGNAKAEALEKLLIKEVTFGNETVKVVVKPSNEEPTLFDLYKDAFSGNSAVDGYATSLMGMNYVLFKPEVVQYYNDDLGDANGICSTLYQDMVSELFENRDGIFFCTSKII